MIYRYALHNLTQELMQCHIVHKIGCAEKVTLKQQLCVLVKKRVLIRLTAQDFKSISVKLNRPPPPNAYLNGKELVKQTNNEIKYITKVTNLK
jgi:hypothetical protein